MVVKLLEGGVDPRHKDPFGNTALDKARLHQNKEIESILSKAMANPGNYKDFSSAESFDRSGKYRTFLHY